jgi:hypothetical protein
MTVISDVTRKPDIRLKWEGDTHRQTSGEPTPKSLLATSSLLILPATMRCPEPWGKQ